MTGAPSVYLIAGEPSGDALGGPLIAAIRDRVPAAGIAGIGGEAMAEAGLASLFPMAELAVMGLVEIVPHIPRLLRRIDQTVADILVRRPEVVVTIDAPGFGFRVARKLRDSGRFEGRLVHYVAPTVWAWRPGRARKVAALYDHLLVILPFEPPWFEREGLATTFIGHPVVERGLGQGNGAMFRERNDIPREAPVLAVLPGSRRGEVRRLAPVFAETVGRVAREVADLRVVVPTVPTVAGMVEEASRSWPAPVTLSGMASEKADLFAASNAALAASGTVAVELAAAGVPAVVGYRLNPVTAIIVDRLVKVPYANLINLVLNRMAVPEFMLEDCRAPRMAPAVVELLTNPDVATAQRAAAADALRSLGAGGDAPSARAADAILDLLSGD